MLAAATTSSSFSHHCQQHSDLIVDFVHNRLPTMTMTSPTKTQTTKKKKQVCFAETKTTHTLKYRTSQQNAKTWYSEKDKVLFKSVLHRDVRSFQHLLATTPMEELSQEALYECIGLEGLLSIELMYYVKSKRRDHVRSIIKRQEMLSDEQLALSSVRSSFASRERAQQLAAGYFAILS
jgi:hypothetical protein